MAITEYLDAYLVASCLIDAYKDYLPTHADKAKLRFVWRNLPDMFEDGIRKCKEPIAAYVLGKAYEAVDPSNLPRLTENIVKAMLDPKKRPGTAEGIVALGASAGGKDYIFSKLQLTQARDPRFNPFEDVDWSTAVRTHMKCAPDTGERWDRVEPWMRRVDVTGDGLGEMLVKASCPTTTSSWPENVYVFDGKSPVGVPTLIGTLPKIFIGSPAKWGDYLRDVEVSTDGMKIILKSDALSESAAYCCADLRVHLEYEWSKGRFHEVKRVVRKR